MFIYTFIYGLTVGLNAKIPGIAAIDFVPDHVDVEIVLGELPFWLGNRNESKTVWYVSKEDEPGAEPSLVICETAGGLYFQVRYSDGTEFLINKFGTRIWGTWSHETLTLEDTATYLLGPIMGFVLLLHGRVSLHASTIVIGGKAIALIGPAGAGKSTTAAAFAELGYSVLAEDVSTLDDRGTSFLVQPAYPCIRLWPASVKALYGTEGALPKLTPTWDKCYLDLSQEQYEFEKESVPLAAIYLLSKRSDDPAAPLVRELSISEAVIALTANTYGTYLMKKAMLARAFELFGRVTTHIPVKKLIPHADPANIPKLCELIIKDFQGSQLVDSQSLDPSYPLHV